MSYQAPVGEPPLDHPWYGIGFGAAIKRAFTKYATFSGRASRGEYWWFVLFVGIVYFGLGILGGVIGAATARPNGQMGPAAIPFFVLWFIFLLAVIVPSIAIGVRRLHDAGFSGWFLLLNLIPSVGGIIVLVLCVLPTSPQASKYGPPVPEGWQPGYPAGYQQGYPQGGYQQSGYPQVGYQQGGYSQPGYPQPGYQQAEYPEQYGSAEQGGYPGQPGQTGGGYSSGGSDQPGSANPPRN